MQSIRIDVRELFRYSPDGDVEPNHGGIVSKWKRSPTTYRLNFYPMESGRTHDEYGYTDSVTWRVILNHATPFKLGDRIGDSKGMLYEVIKVRTFRDQQQMEAREIWLGR